MANMLKPSSHVTRAVDKANQLLGLVRRSLMYIDRELMKQQSTSTIRPNVEYWNVCGIHILENTSISWKQYSIEGPE